MAPAHALARNDAPEAMTVRAKDQSASIGRRPQQHRATATEQISASPVSPIAGPALPPGHWRLV